MMLMIYDSGITRRTHTIYLYKSYTNSGFIEADANPSKFTQNPSGVIYPRIQRANLEGYITVISNNASQYVVTILAGSI